MGVVFNFLWTYMTYIDIEHQLGKTYVVRIVQVSHLC